MQERMRRLWAGAEAEAIGRGGIALVARAAGLAISTVTLGRNEVRGGARVEGLVKERRKGGGRKGLLGIEKADIDLALGVITVRRSYDRDTTKGGHADVIPIAQPLRAFLVDALEASRSKYVFPADDGLMRSDETDLQQVLARALGRAQIVRGWEHICRRKGCGHREQSDTGTPSRCPKCEMKLWPKALPRKMRFHDLRGTTATLLARAGVPLVIAQRILRHTDPRLTANIYTHVDVGGLRAGIDRLGIPKLDWMAEKDELAKAKPSPSREADQLNTNDSVSPDPRGANGASVTDSQQPFSPAPRFDQKGRPHPLGFLQGRCGLILVGETGFEPATPWSRTRCSTRLSHSPTSRRCYSGSLLRGAAWVHQRRGAVNMEKARNHDPL